MDYLNQEDGQIMFDTRLESERNVEENVAAAIEFTCHQIASENPPKVTSRYDGYGIASEHLCTVKVAMKEVEQAMKTFLAILPTSEYKGIESAASLKNSASKLVLATVLLAAHADRIMNDLYEEVGATKTPLEEYADSLNDENFEEAEETEEEAADDADEKED